MTNCGSNHNFVDDVGDETRRREAPIRSCDARRIRRPRFPVVPGFPGAQRINEDCAASGEIARRIVPIEHARDRQIVGQKPRFRPNGGTVGPSIQGKVSILRPGGGRRLERVLDQRAGSESLLRVRLGMVRRSRFESKNLMGERLGEVALYREETESRDVYFLGDGRAARRRAAPARPSGAAWSVFASETVARSLND